MYTHCTSLPGVIVEKEYRDMLPKLLIYTSLTLSFLLELCVLLALGYWGFQIGPTMVARIGLGIGAPLLAIGIWALFGAPKSAWQLHGFGRLLLVVFFFGSAAVALFMAGQPTLGAIFALVFVLNWPISEKLIKNNKHKIFNTLEKG